MSDVTVDACDVPRFMRASPPEQPVSSLMTRQAGAVLFISRVSGIFGETDGNGIFATSRLDMSFAGTVAGFAAKPFLLIFGTRERFAHDGVLKAPALVRMANDAGFAARVLAVKVRGFGCGRPALLTAQGVARNDYGQRRDNACQTGET